MTGILLFSAPFVFVFVLVVLARNRPKWKSRRHREFMEGPRWER